MEMICAQDFDFETTMTSYEAMDIKMDLRMQRCGVKEKKGDILKALETGEYNPMS